MAQPLIRGSQDNLFSGDSRKWPEPFVAELLPMQAKTAEERVAQAAKIYSHPAHHHEASLSMDDAIAAQCIRMS